MSNTIPIDIPSKKFKYIDSYLGFNIPESDKLTYEFILKIELKDGKEKLFKKIQSNAYAKLILFDDLLNFKDIEGYKLSLKIKSNIEEEFELIDKLEEVSFYSNNNNNLFIEFSQNNLGYVLCNCHYITNFGDKILSVPNSYNDKL